MGNRFHTEDRNIAVAVRLTKDEASRLDEGRGDMSRSEYLRKYGLPTPATESLSARLRDLRAAIDSVEDAAEGAHEALNRAEDAAGAPMPNITGKAARP